MKMLTLKALAKKQSSPFQETARNKGLSTKQALALEPEAENLFPEEPHSALETREAFEKVASQSLQVALANLELSFAAAEELASALEVLQLGRSSEVPDSFRMVWVKSDSAPPLQGVVIPGREGEVAVFCPLKAEAPNAIGTDIDLEYRGSDTEGSFQLKLRDAVCLPEARVLHLAKRQNATAGHGRVFKRHAVEIVGFVRRSNEADGNIAPMPCRVVDISIEGARLRCASRIEKGVQIQLDVFLDDGIGEPFSIACEVRWLEAVPEGHQIGLHFEELSPGQAKRMDQAIRLLHHDS